jgi:hypothetical protein
LGADCYIHFLIPYTNWLSLLPKLSLLIFVACLACTKGGRCDDERLNFVADAAGTGNFLVCLDAAIADEVEAVSLPAGVIFQGEAKHVGNLRHREVIDVSGQIQSPEQKETQTYAVVTTQPFTVSNSAPCRRVSARTLVFGAYGWTHINVPAAQHWRYTAQLLQMRPDMTAFFSGGINGLKPTPFDYARKNLGFNGTPVREIGAPVRIKD